MKEKRKSKYHKTRPVKSDISYHNKDIVSKLLGERLRGKSLSLFGVSLGQKIKDILPTNLPIVKANELRIDNLFLLDDGSVAIIDYESSYSIKNMLKYGRYITSVMERYIEKGEYPVVHMIVIYTADVERVESYARWESIGVYTKSAYLTGIDSQARLADIQEQIANQTITDDTLMNLILLPLTCKGTEAKQEAIKTCVMLAGKIENKEQETFALAGILAFTDKVISRETEMHIKEVLSMTKVGKLIFDEGREKGREEGLEYGIKRGKTDALRKVGKNMLRRGQSYAEIMEVTGLSQKQIKEIEAEMAIHQ